jgi:hypothetical protein
MLSVTPVAHRRDSVEVSIDKTSDIYPCRTRMVLGDYSAAQDNMKEIVSGIIAIILSLIIASEVYSAS